MPFAKMLHTLLLGPLEMLFEVIYVEAFKIQDNAGLAIVVLSLVMNVLLLPLYRRTDAIQEEAIATEKKMRPYVDHIKKTFGGNERFMLLQTCYRQHHYKPTDAIKGLTPLLLEIPFFMAAYNFLSGLDSLNHAVFGPIGNLGAPDGLIVIGGIAINLLPILMTAINLISSAIYTKDAPMKTKVQLFGMAALFLILLYDSPAGLVLYWTLNNVFSLVKNILMKSKKPLLRLSFVTTPLSVVGVILAFYYPMPPLKTALAVAASLCLNLPLVMHFVQKRGPKAPKPVAITGKDHIRFVCGAAVVTLLMGLLIPSAVIRTAPEEFIIIGTDMNPTTAYVLHTFLLAAGVFLVWMNLFYMLASNQWKRKMELGMWFFCGAAIVDYMFFGKNYGTLSNHLVFDVMFTNSTGVILLNLAVLAAVMLVIWFVFKKKPGIFTMVGATLMIAMLGMSAVNISGSQKVIAAKMEQLENFEQPDEELFKLSKTGKNVVVLMLDRAVGAYVPYMLNEIPALQEQFAGFTYYPNTISFGPFTNVGLSGVFGGYEYTPVEMNKRSELRLRDKHNEAMKVMPVLFDENGYDVTVCDPSYAGYDWIPDLSIYNDYPDIDTHITMGRYNEHSSDGVATVQHNMFFYSLMKVCPVAVHRYIYQGGSYLATPNMSQQTCHDSLTATGKLGKFENFYNVLHKLPELTGISEAPANTFQMMCNETSHTPVLLQLPNYEYTDSVDNTPFEAPIPVRKDGKGHTIKLNDLYYAKHYHCNMAAFLQIGQWLDYLRENGVYDNTRIILVSDHARNVGILPRINYPDGGSEDLTYFNALLMVKDFGSTEFKTDKQLMTNADVPTIATTGLIEKPVNPFTGKPISSESKTRDPLYILDTLQWDVTLNNGDTFKEDRWLQFVGEDVHNLNSWKYAGFGTLPDGVSGN